MSIIHRMPRLVLSIAAVTFLWIDMAGAQEEVPRNQFKDDFQVDSRAEYEVEGDVQWTAGVLSFGDHSSVRRSAPLGPDVELSLALSSPRSDSGEQIQTRFGLEFDDGERVLVVITWSHEVEEPGSVRLVRVRPSESAANPGPSIRTSVLTELPDAEWAMRYRHGVVEVLNGGERQAIGYAGFHDQGVKAIVLSQDGGVAECRKIQFDALQPAPSPHADQLKQRQQLMPEFLQAKEKMESLFARETMQQCIEPAEKTLELSTKLFGAESSKTLEYWGKLGLCYQYSNAADKALQTFQDVHAIQVRKFGQRHPDAARTESRIALLLGRMGEQVRSLQHHQQAASVFEEVVGIANAETAFMLSNLAFQHRRMQRVAESIPLYEKALASHIAAFGEDSVETATHLSDMASAQIRIRLFQEARQNLDRALEIRRTKLGDEHSETLGTIEDIAELLLRVGMFAEARRQLDDLLAVRRKKLGNNHPDVAMTLSLLGMLQEQIGDVDAALSYLSMALDAYQRSGNASQYDITNTIRQLSTLHLKLGNVEQAREYALSAYERLKAAYGPRDLETITSMSDLGNVLLVAGQLDEAQEKFASVLETWKEMGREEYSEAVQTHNYLALTAMRKGDNTVARRHFAKALEGYTRLLGEDAPTTANVRRGLADVLQKLGEREEAMQMHRTAAEALRSSLGEKNPFTAEAYEYLGHAYHQDGDFVAAVEQYNKALDLRLGFADEFLDTLSEAEALSFAASIYRSRDGLLGVFRLIRLNDQQELKQLLRTMPVVKARDVYSTVWKARALATESMIRRSARPPADAKARETWQQLQETRALLSKYTLAVAPGEMRGQLDEAVRQLTERKEQLQRALAAFGVKPAKSEALTVDDLITLLPSGTAVIDVVLSVAGGGPFNLAGEEKQRYYDAFVIRSDARDGDSVQWVHLGPADRIDDGIRKWRAAINTRQDPSELLSDLVWARVEPHLGDAQRVIVIPDGAITRLPWGALRTLDGKRMLIEDRAFGIANHGQQLARLLKKDTQVDDDNMMLVGGVDYDKARSPEASLATARSRGVLTEAGGAPAWIPLPGTLAEVKAVSELATDALEVSVLTKESATEARVRADLPKSRYIHLATHGFFSDPRFKSAFEPGRSLPTTGVDDRKTAVRNPLILSGLILAGANESRDAEPTNQVGDDGVLTAEEIAGLDLSGTELVVLSACETGLGDVAAGEGVFGLQRTFAIAGAKTVVASLWKVDDDATQALMSEFYRNLLERKQGKLEALRQAQLTMMKRFDIQTGRLRAVGGTAKPIEPSKTEDRLSPHFWSSFVLSGDWR